MSLSPMFPSVFVWFCLSLFIPDHDDRDPATLCGSWVFFYFPLFPDEFERRSHEKNIKNFSPRLNFLPFSWSTTWGAKTLHQNIDNWIHIHQVRSWAGAEVPAEWRCAKTHLPFRVITGRKVASVSEPFWNIRLHKAILAQFMILQVESFLGKRRRSKSADGMNLKKTKIVVTLVLTAEL